MRGSAKFLLLTLVTTCFVFNTVRLTAFHPTPPTTPPYHTRAGMNIALIVYRTPMRAGSCYVFYNSIIRGPSPEMRAKMGANKKPTMQAHLEMLRFFVSLFGEVYCGVQVGCGRKGWLALLQGSDSLDVAPPVCRERKQHAQNTQHSPTS